MFRILVFSLVTALAVNSCTQREASYASSWDKSPEGIWAGPDLWANRLQDWQVMNGELLCSGPGPMRTVHLTSRYVSEEKGTFHSSVIISAGENTIPSAAAGILVGAGHGMNWKAASLIHHSWGPGAGIFIGLDGNSNLFIRDFEKEDFYFAKNKTNSQGWDQAYLLIHIKPGDGEYKLQVTAVNPATNQVIDKLEYERFPGDRLAGNVAIVAHAGYDRESNSTFRFGNWKVYGSKLRYDPVRVIGPIIGSQYTLSRNKLKLTAQMVPVGSKENHKVTLSLLKNNNWEKAAEADIEDYSYIARFSIDNWKDKEDIQYRLSYKTDRGREITWTREGIIRHDPVDRDSLVLLSLSCIDQTARIRDGKGEGIDRGQFPWDWALLYPHNKIVDNLKKFDADLLFFAGDQIYEGSSPTGADTGQNDWLDYLYKWYLFHQVYYDLTAVTPSISIPDDHDVYHGNLWGAGGKATPEGLKGAAAQDAGGYKRSPEFVNMVQATQTSHLPDPFDPEPVEQDISVYYTECNVGGVSFAILEDRKFKSAPRDMLPEADIYNGWPRNLDWNGKRQSRIEAVLLGNRQLDFLEEWAGDWSNQTWMKAVLSQTLFANLGTIPADALNDNIVQGMAMPDSGVIVTGDRFVTDFDSDGWPQVGRDRALRLFRKAFATHIVGDQHLASTIHYGIDTWRDAGFVIVSPAVGNLWSRRWFPPVAGRNREEGWAPNLGDFEDGFGNKITVHAVANPHKTAMKPARHYERATGYSAITFYRDTRDISLSNWPYYAGPGNGQPYPGWPVRINQSDNYGRQVTQWLPEIQVSGLENPVIKIFREVTGEMIYSLRIKGQSYQPGVFSFGSYRIEVGEPDTGEWQNFEGIFATSSESRRPLEAKF